MTKTAISGNGHRQKQPKPYQNGHTSTDGMYRPNIFEVICGTYKPKYSLLSLGSLFQSLQKQSYIR